MSETPDHPGPARLCPEALARSLAALGQRLVILEAEAEIRRLQARYMFLCDTPIPEPGVRDDPGRIDLIMELFAEEAVWEGVGAYYDSQFGRAEGKAAVRRHFEGFWGGKQDPSLVLNAHYLTSEQIRVAPDGETAEGQWIHVQPWLFSDGKALLRSSRLSNAFRRCADGRWRFTRNRTENVFVAPLQPGWASDYLSRSVLMQP